VVRKLLIFAALVAVAIGLGRWLVRREINRRVGFPVEFTGMYFHWPDHMLLTGVEIRDPELYLKSPEVYVKLVGFPPQVHSITVPSLLVRLESNPAEALRRLKRGDSMPAIEVKKGRIELRRANIQLPEHLRMVASTIESADADWSAANRMVTVTNLTGHGPGLRVEGSGEIGFDRTVNLKITAHLGERRIGLVVEGTTDEPQVRADVKQIVMEEGKRLFRRFFGGGP
jgi:hypothetical protein